MSSFVSAKDSLIKKQTELQYQEHVLEEYLAAKKEEKDYHGVWDAAIDLAVNRAEQKGIKFAIGCVQTEELIKNARSPRVRNSK